MKILKNLGQFFVNAAILTGWLIGLVIIAVYVYPQFGMYLEQLGG